MSWLGTKRPSWVRNNWVRNDQGYEMTGNRLCFIIIIIIIIIIVIIIITGSGLHQWIHKIHLFQSRHGKSVFITESNQVIRRFKGFIQFFRAQNWIFRLPKSLMLFFDDFVIRGLSNQSERAFNAFHWFSIY